MILAMDSDTAGLRDRLAELEAEQATLEAELAIFDADYTREVLTVLAQLHDLQARVLGLVAGRSGEAGDAAAARAADARAQQTSSAVRAVPLPPGPLPTRELKRLFRDAAKRMHPDLAGRDDARGHAEAFMKRLNQAYRTADTAAILDLVSQWEASPYALDGEAFQAARPASTTRLQAAVARAERRLDELRASELAELMERSMAATAAGADFLAEARAAAEAALAAARARLAGLERRP